MDDIRESLSRMTYEELLDEAVWTRSFLNNVAEQCRVGGHSSLVAYVDKLRAENDKLRELARNLERARRALCDDTLYDCDECAAYSICDTKLAKPMQELGIEVDG